MFLEKITQEKSGIIVYGITPPKAHNSLDKNNEIAAKTVERIKKLNIDGLIIYDIQDEASRNSDDRPFPFLKTIDPYEYASEYLKELEVHKIIYRCVGKYERRALSTWLNSHDTSKYSSVFVGAPSKHHVSTMKLSEAYDLRNSLSNHGILGGVTIFERHFKNENEHLRIIEKMQYGCSVFITQCIFNIGYAKDVLSDLYFYCLANDLKIPTIIFTLTTCGSLKTLNFMEWLGIHCPKWMKNELKNSHDILDSSINLSLAIAEEIAEFCTSKNIPFGINIESVSLLKDEIDASIELLNKTTQILKEKVKSKNAATISLNR